LLGDKVQHEFGHLPYLLKVLDVQKMLSIQVHPTKEAAAVAFANENALGIPLDAANRNYKDANHKPELMVALSDFWLLHGFKPPEEMADILMNVTELKSCFRFLQSGYEGLYKHVMEMPQAEVNRILAPLIQNLSENYKTELPDKYVEDYWVLKAIEQFPHHGNIDRGFFQFIFSIWCI
jgi:mannose-6-phosphate isomerase